MCGDSSWSLSCVQTVLVRGKVSKSQVRPSPNPGGTAVTREFNFFFGEFNFFFGMFSGNILIDGSDPNNFLCRRLGPSAWPCCSVLSWLDCRFRRRRSISMQARKLHYRDHWLMSCPVRREDWQMACGLPTAVAGQRALEEWCRDNVGYLSARRIRRGLGIMYLV